jgi:hypothetical protein
MASGPIRVQCRTDVVFQEPLDLQCPGALIPSACCLDGPLPPTYSEYRRSFPSTNGTRIKIAG